MFSKSKNKNVKERKKRDPNAKADLTKFGLLEIPDISNLSQDFDNDEGDEALEAELLSLTKGEKHRNRPRKAIPPQDLDHMVNECMRDDIDEDLSDSEDQDLLNELSFLVSNDPNDDGEEIDRTPSSATSPSTCSAASSEVISPVKPKPLPTIVRPTPVAAGPSVLSLLQERLLNYKEAEEHALAAGETSRARRFTRGLKNLNQMLKAVESGKPINEDEIPPAVLAKSSRSNSSVNLNQEEGSNDPNSSAPTLNNSTIPQNVAFEDGDRHKDDSFNREEIPPPSALSTIMHHQVEYKKAAIEAKKRGDKEAAIHFLRVAKQMDPLIEAANNMQEVDLRSLPPLPIATSENTIISKKEDSKSPVSVEHSSSQVSPAPPMVNAPPEQASASVSDQGQSAPQSTIEALEQRLAKYIEQKNKAVSENNARKERMNQRIVKQYQEAIKLHKLGRHVDFEELPSPPGFPPIPAGSAAPPKPPNAAPPQDSAPAPATSSNSALPEKSAGAPAGKVSEADPTAAPLRPARKAPPPNVRNAPQSRVERQVSLLKKRQQHFREAALDAKKRGEIEQAKEYLRNSKGFDQLIFASQGGLPVDMNTVPIPPQEAVASFNTTSDFEIITKDDCHIPASSTPSDIALAYTKIEDDLIEQIKTCAHTREHFKALGDVASANRFEQLILHTKKDLDAVRVAFKRGDTPPRFHYETRSFTLIQCNTDLNDSDLELTIVRGINFNVPNPKDVDTCVKIEFPYPAEAPPQEKSDVVKDTNTPEYNYKVVFSIDRKSRALARIFKRQSIKCQIVAKGGWFHRDSVFGMVKVPLVSLENQCTLHESYDLLDEKKKMVGGKLEVKVRVRNPILTKQLEKVTKKWLVIDGF